MWHDDIYIFYISILILHDLSQIQLFVLKSENF